MHEWRDACRYRTGGAREGRQEAYSQSLGRGEWDVVIGVRSSLTDPGPDFTIADAILRLLMVHPTKLNARGGKPVFLGNAPWKDIAIDGAGAHAGPKSVMLRSCPT